MSRYLDEQCLVMCGALHLCGHLPDPQQRIRPPHQPTAGAAGVVGTPIALLGGFDRAEGLGGDVAGGGEGEHLPTVQAGVAGVDGRRMPALQHHRRHVATQQRPGGLETLKMGRG